jgi:hypothetical protein
MNNVQDSVANTITLAGLGSVLMDLQPLLTFLLLVSGIILNITRIRNTKKD